MASQQSNPVQRQSQEKTQRSITEYATKKIEWQTTTKKRKFGTVFSPPQGKSQASPPTKIKNRFEKLNDENGDAQADLDLPTKENTSQPKLSPIFLQNVTNYTVKYP
ncbi:hypothetical protein PGB90_008993 [Kerria lacca]